MVELRELDREFFDELIDPDLGALGGEGIPAARVGSASDGGGVRVDPLYYPGSNPFWTAFEESAAKLGGEE